jgi:hypothetical protein
MQSSNRPLTPLAAVAAGFLAGAVGITCMDAIWLLGKVWGQDKSGI